MEQADVKSLYLIKQEKSWPRRAERIRCIIQSPDGQSKIRRTGGIQICQVLPEMLQKAEISPDEIAGIGIDGQSWSAIAVDENGNVLTNTPIWMDTRAQDICDELNERIGKDRIFKLCGNSLQPSYTTSKIVWYQRNLPEVYAKTAKILQSNSYIAFKLTGKMTQDVSQGYGLHCFNMQEMTWDFAMCEELGFSKDLLPEIYPCHAVIGTVTEERQEVDLRGNPGCGRRVWMQPAQPLGGRCSFTMERHRSKAGRQGG